MRTIFAALICTLLLVLPVVAQPPGNEAPGKDWVYLGTYTHKGSEGIYVAEFDPQTGKLSEPKLAGKAKSPSFLAIHPNRRFLYAVTEESQFQGQPGGGVLAFSIDRPTGMLKSINGQSSVGRGPCHVSLDKAGRYLFVANYGDGVIAGLPIKDDGSLESSHTMLRLRGTGPNKARQEKSHAHSINVSPDDNHAVSADLGSDMVTLFKLNEKREFENAGAGGMVKVPPGGGPRHFAFHPNGKFGYVNNELTSSVTVMKYDGKHGTLEAVETVPTLPTDFTGRSGTAEIQVHPNGQFLYVSNRGHDSLAVFAIQQNGTLKSLGHVSTGGKTPRNFCVHPSGRFLLAANQDTDNVVVFRIDPAKGMPEPTGASITVKTPVCVRFMKQ